MKIFKKEGIDVSDKQLDALVEQETNDVKNPGPAASTNARSKIDGINPSIEDIEDEVIRLDNPVLCVMHEYVDISKGSLKQGIQNSLDDFLMKDKK